jgi:hypothetical protein
MTFKSYKVSQIRNVNTPSACMRVLLPAQIFIASDQGMALQEVRKLCVLLLMIMAINVFVASRLRRDSLSY